MLRAIVDKGDGTVAVIIPAPKTVEEMLLAKDEKGRPVFADATAAVTAIVEKDCGGFPYEIVDEKAVPSDRYFRGAWTLNAGAVKVDMGKARDIHMERIRRVRDAELKRLDIEQLKGNDVSVEKQALRDVPQIFDLTGADTPEQLKALWPAELPARS